MESTPSIYELNDMMEFDHVIHVHENGRVTSDDTSGLYAPSLYNDELDSDGWKLLDGFSGQDSYSGPIMHDSEFIGGGLARYILNQPGYYVALVSYYSPEDGQDDDDTVNTEGWAIAYRETL